MRAGLTIGLAGFYGRGNFGDDLMALLIGCHLRGLGCRCVVVGLDDQMATAHGLESVPAPDALGDAVDVVIVGGGAMLARLPRFPISRSLRAHLGNAADHLRQLVRRCRDRGIPLWAVSIGGDGASLGRLAPFQRELVEAASFATVRNPGDVELFRALGKQVRWHPDIVLATSHCFPRRVDRPARRTIGIDLYRCSLIAGGALYLPSLIRAIARRRPDVDFVFIDTTHRRNALFAAVRPPPGKAHARCRQFEMIKEDLSFLASLDMLVSNRLHLGVAALSYGVPFLSAFGERKTRLFMEQTGLAACCFSHRNISQLARLLLDAGRFEAALASYPWDGVQAASERSAEHLRDLERALAAL